MEAALVGAASRFMVDKVAVLLKLDEKLKTITGTKRKMEKLKELAPIIDTVIQHIESRPLMEDAVKELLKKLKYLAYDLEDVVDYYDTKVFQKKQRSKSLLRPVSDFFSADNQVAFKSRVGGMIKAITDSLDSILLQNSILSNLLQEQGSIPMSEPSLNNRETHSRNGFVVIGREPEKNKIVNMLTKDDDDDDESNHGIVKVIAIVGTGGLGKTTLAQHVYNDARVQDHFASPTMWKVVGAEFNPTKIMKSLLELATGGSSVNISEIDLVKRKLEEALSGKRFLLVLDDVWNEDELQWGVLKAALTCGARGSKILVTTRSKRVSSIMSSSNTTHQIQQLSRGDCLFLFQQFAFGDQTVDQNLMAIGAKIVEKCGGVPLAAISLGSMLRSTREENYWSSVLNSEIWKLGNQEDKVLAVLKLSYDALPLRSKKCFAFASLFSKDVTMKKYELIKLWIANGFVRSEGNFDAETVGEHVFDDLVLRSFFLLVPSRYVTECTMHDLMRDLARSVSADVYWNSYQDSVENFGNRTYHLQIDGRKFPNMTQDLGKKPLYLRTFMQIYTFSHLSINLLELFSELKPLYLRALDLTNGGIREVPTSIGILIHLRYLNLSQNHIEVLPDSITLLPNLQYLNLRCNYELRELPKELGEMKNLRDLDLLSNSRLTHMPCGLSRLTNLRSLPLFIAGGKTGACSIIELENLKLHGKMRIEFLKDFKNYSCGGRKILKNKNLNELCIVFNESYDKDMFVDLCPNTSLKRLELWGYSSPQFPVWLMESQLPNLVEVSLRNCRDCELIPPFGNLQFLKKLNLYSMNGITHLGDEFHGYRGFPSLRELSLNWMSNLEEWSESHVVDQLFPLLQKLLIFWCPKLKSTPRLPRIRRLEISSSESILSCIGRFTSLSLLQLTGMPDIASLPSGCIRNLTSLTNLQIISCRRLQSLPRDEMQYLEMLRSLTIDECDNLVFFPSEVGSLSSLCFRQNGVISQPKELVQILNSVDEFRIEICGNKVDLRGQLQYLHTLKILSLFGSHLNNQLMFKYEIRALSICCCDELESFMAAEATNSTKLEQLYINGFSNLTTMPDWLQHLKSLRRLSIRNCPRLERVPRDLKNLHMLKTLKIVGCPRLKSRCARETGEDWPIISNVPNVDIE
ncbi:putative disease resistance protein RGA1 [Zingiber officinale]|nr:putative disease resistance protein RGA1 [Zingiber officinale]XP_042384268.1 putative disease resistance protein RGA1 [Zingiber officinale]XP_042384269.1 putative disease resistance protein RGA1 [Zingiber officinale]